MSCVSYWLLLYETLIQGTPVYIQFNDFLFRVELVASPMSVLNLPYLKACGQVVTNGSTWNMSSSVQVLTIFSFEWSL